MSIFDDVRGVNCIDAARMLGISVKMRGRRGWALCPFHRETGHASLVFYEDNRGWYCYGCHVGGDAVRLYELYNDEEPLEAARQVAQDFGIAVSDDGTLTVNAHHLETALERRRKKRLLELGQAYIDADDRLQAIIRSDGPEAAMDDPQFFEALRERDRIFAEQQQLMDADTEQLLEWFAPQGGETHESERRAAEQPGSAGDGDG